MSAAAFDIRAAPEESLRNYVKSVFSAYDVDHSGDIDKEEFQDLLYSLGEIVDDKAAEAAFAKIDTDASGKISFEEFFSWWVKSGIDQAGGAIDTSDPTAALQAKLGARSLVRSLASTLDKVRAGTYDSHNKEEIKLDVNFIAGKIERFSEKNTRLNIHLKQTGSHQAGGAGQAPAVVELTFSLIQGSDPAQVEEKVRSGLAEIIDMAKMISPVFSDLAMGIRKSADGSKDEFFMRVPLPAVPAPIASMASKVGFAVALDVEVKSDEAGDIDALLVHLNGTLSKSIFKILGQVPLPLPRPMLGVIGSLNRFSTTIDFDSMKELRASRSKKSGKDGEEKTPASGGFIDKQKMAKKLAGKFFVPSDVDPFAPLLAQAYYIIQENLKFIEKIHVNSTGVDLDIQIHATDEWTFQSKLPSRAEVEDARPSLKHYATNLTSLNQAPGRPEGEMQGWVPSAIDPNVTVFVRWVDKAQFDQKDRQAEYKILAAGLKNSETFFKEIGQSSETPQVVASGEDPSGAWQVLSWAHDTNWETGKPYEYEPLGLVLSVAAARCAVSKLVKRLEEWGDAGWCFRYLAPSDLFIGKTADRQVCARLLRADLVVKQVENISPFAEPRVTAPLALQAPEIASFSEYDKKVDVWAVGVLTYMLMTGREPQENLAVQKEPTDADDDDGEPFPLKFDDAPGFSSDSDIRSFFKGSMAPLSRRKEMYQLKSTDWISWAPWNLPEEEAQPTTCE